MNTSVITNTFHKVAIQVRKHSPEILAVVGAGLTIGGTVVACKATTKASAILEETKTNVDAIHECLENEEYAEEYSEEDSKKDLVITYVQTGVKMAKLYAPAVVMLGLGIGCMFTSNNILRKRNVALGAAYATLDKGYKKYRENVVERFGENVDRELKYNLKAKKVTEKVVDEETGKEKSVKTVKYVVECPETTEHARWFGSYTRNIKGEVIPNVCWNSDNSYNIKFIKDVESWANKILQARGHLFLNEVYDRLGFPRSIEGQEVGWVFKKGVFEPRVSFGYMNDPASWDDYVYGNDDEILLDFNVNGIVWDLL